MTRANVLVITRGSKTYFSINSSAYPSETMADIINFATSCVSRNAIFDGKIGLYDNPNSFDLSTFIKDAGLRLGKTSADYHYEIDFVSGTIRVWESKSRWVNAPLDWEVKGWQGCYTDKGRFGYRDHWVKGKKIYDVKILSLVACVDHNDKLTLINNAILDAENIGK